ncbi:MAG: glucosaminidase domain-containing protein [Bacteroidetes bacterium]|nr:glucosaminidase domain-containing protein [Bacteroidota bacterium]
MKSSCCHTELIYTEKDQNICLNESCENYLAPVAFTYTPRFWNNLFAFFFFVFIFLFTFNDYSYNKNAITDSADALLKIQQCEPLTNDNLKFELKKLEIICRDEVFAQFQIESGHLSSFLLLRTNNLCGMRYPFRRSTAAIGIFLPDMDTIIKGNQKALLKYSRQNNYAVYASWQDCLKDYKLWQDECFRLKERYLSFLGNNYAEDTGYVKKIKQVKK